MQVCIRELQRGYYRGNGENFCEITAVITGRGQLLREYLGNGDITSGNPAVIGVLTRLESLDPGKGISRLPRIETSDRPTTGLL